MKQERFKMTGPAAAILTALVMAFAGAARPAVAGNHKMSISFSGYTNRTENLTDFPVLLVLSNGVGGSSFNFGTYPFLSTNGYDLRIYTNEAGTGAGLNYEIERWDTNTASYVWVQVPELLSNGTSVVWAKWGDTENSGQLPCTTNGATWGNGFTGVWHLKETSGAHQDSTSNLFNSTTISVALQGSATGMVDGADCLNGSAQRVIVPALNLNANTVTITACVNGHQNADWVGIVCSRAGDTKAGILSVGNNVRYNWNDSTYTWVSGLAIPTDQPAYLALAVSANNAVGYVNGSAASNTVAHAIEEFNGETDFGLDRYDTSVRRWIGVIDEVRISKATRSGNWLWAEWMNMASNTVFNSYGTVATEQTEQTDGLYFFLR